MLNSDNIVRLYNRVLDNDMLQYNIPESAIRVGIKSMSEVYKPGKGLKNTERSTVADFNDAAHRCAYLHKYAALHTAMVRDMMFSAIRQNYNFFRDLIFSERTFKICSLGGGPGTDIIGVLASLLCTFSRIQTSVTVVDYMVNWSYSFSSILNELNSGFFEPFGQATSEFLQWRYMGANLLKPLTPEVEREISSASLVTMIKFVSAASCKDTEFMVKNILTAMKPGAVLFFIDNDGGGFRELMMKAAYKYNFVPIFGPFQHENYINEIVKVKRFGAVSCHKTIVSVHMLQKPFGIEQRMQVTVPNTYSTSSLGYSRRVLIDSPFRGTTSAFYDDPPYADENSFRGPLQNNHPHIDESPYGVPLLGASSYAGVDTFLPHGQYFNENVNFNNNHLCSPIQSTPLTPYVFQLESNHVATPVERNDIDYRRPIYSPETPRPRSRIHAKSGCLPVSKFRNWRHNLSRKFNTFKSSARSVLQEKYSRRKIKKSQDAKK